MSRERGRGGLAGWLRLLPASFRERFGDEMAAAFESRLAEARSRGACAAVWLWVRTVVDLLRTAVLERVRPMGGWGHGMVRDDVRVAVRGLARRPVFAITVVLTVGLGIGANAAVFSMVDAVLLRPLPLESPDRVVRVWGTNAETGQSRHYVAPRDLIVLRESTRTLSGLSAWYPSEATVLVNGEPVRVGTLLVTTDLFDVLGVRVPLGRTLVPEDAGTGSGATGVMLTHEGWQRLFGADARVVGRTLQGSVVGAPAWPIVGVLPPGLEWLHAGADVILPFPDLSLLNAPDDRWLSAVGRLAAGVGLEEAGAELHALGRALEEADPARNRSWRYQVAPLHEAVVGDTRTAMLVLLGAAGLVLLVAAANVGALLLGRASLREREIALRGALGAGRGRVVRLVLTETLLLASVGATVGVLFAYWLVDGLASSGTLALPRIEGARLHAGALGYTAAATVFTAVFLAVAPAVRLLRVEPAGLLRAGGRTATSAGGRERLRAGFLVGQLAISAVLVVGALLLVRSFRALQHSDPGFRAADIVTAEITLPGGYGEPDRVIAFYDELGRRAREIPRVASVAFTSSLPLGTLFDYRAPIDAIDRPTPADRLPPRPWFRQVDEGFFATLGIALTSGRPFTSLDRADAEPVVIVNESAARLFWPGEDAVGRELVGAQRVFGPLGETFYDRVRVIGVARDVHYDDLAIGAEPAVYFPFRQAPFRRMTIVLRTDSPGPALAALRREIAAMDAALAISRITTMDELVARSLSRQWLSSLLVGAFALAALLLASIGLYGTMSQHVSDRTREIGVRVALGAAPTAVLRVMLRDAARIVALGLVLGLAGALAFAQSLASQLHGISARDPLVFASVAGLLALVTALASVIPVARALRVGPGTALRAHPEG